MDGIGEEEGGIRLSKRFGDNKSGEVDYKTKAGSAWSHSYLNQKPWHPLSYPNQRRKWIAEQIHSQRQRRADEVAKEYAQEQEFFRQTALISKKEKEKVEMMKAVSFMYVRPPGYNAESAKAAEIADDSKRTDQNTSDHHSTDVPSTAMVTEPLPGRESTGQDKKKPRPKDVFGRPLPTEEEFEILKNAPRLETGVPSRVKPFGVEVRNVKCLRCGNYGHQSGDRECPLKDAIMPNEESRLRRDDPLTAIMAQMDPTEPLKWELKQKPGMSPPRGGFQPDDPNQQIVADDIFDEYGGFLSGDNIPDLLSNFSCKPKKRKSSTKSKYRRQSSPSSRDIELPDQDELSSPSAEGERKSKKEKKMQKKKKLKKKRHNYSDSSSSDGSEFDRHQRKRRHDHSYSSEDSDSDRQYRAKESGKRHYYTSEDSDSDQDHKGKRSRPKDSYSSEDFDRYHSKSKHKRSYLSGDSDSGRHDRKRNSTQKPYTSDDMDDDSNRSKKNGRKHSYSSEDNDERDRKTKDKHSYYSEKGRHEHRRKTMQKPEESDTDMHNKSNKRRHKHPYLSDDNAERHAKSEKRRHKHYSSHGYEEPDSDAEHRSRRSHHH